MYTDLADKGSTASIGGSVVLRTSDAGSYNYIQVPSIRVPLHVPIGMPIRMPIHMSMHMRMFGDAELHTGSTGPWLASHFLPEP